MSNLIVTFHLGVMCIFEEKNRPRVMQINGHAIQVIFEVIDSGMMHIMVYRPSPPCRSRKIAVPVRGTFGDLRRPSTTFSNSI